MGTSSSALGVSAWLDPNSLSAEAPSGRASPDSPVVRLDRTISVGDLGQIAVAIALASVGTDTISLSVNAEVAFALALALAFSVVKVAIATCGRNRAALLSRVPPLSEDFDRWLALLDEKQVEQQIREFEAQIREFQSQIEQRRQALGLKRGSSGVGDERTMGSSGDKPKRGGQSRSARTRTGHTGGAGATAAIRTLLRADAGRAWSAIELRSALAEQGIVSRGAAGDQRVRSVLSKLVRREEIERLTTGIYRMKTHEPK
jgi:hypothetical protein